MHISLCIPTALWCKRKNEAQFLVNCPNGAKETLNPEVAQQGAFQGKLRLHDVLVLILCRIASSGAGVGA
jgi:hypothetical protein